MPPNVVWLLLSMSFKVLVKYIEFAIVQQKSMISERSSHISSPLESALYNFLSNIMSSVIGLLK